MYLKETPNSPPRHLILPLRKTSDSPVLKKHRITYLAASLTGLSVTLFGLVLFSLPHPAGAFWPFTKTSASTEGADSPILHDGSLNLLEAPINSERAPKNTGEITVSDSALVASGAPTGDSISGENTGSAGSIVLYTVKPGDSLSVIAESHSVSVNTILWANNIKDAKLVKPGTTLIILPVSGLQHTVLKGETLAGLAKKYSADADDIASFNGLNAGAGLTAGSEIIIPGGELPKTTTSAKTTIKTGGGLTSIKKNAYKGGSGVEIDGYYGNPVPGALVTQAIHGWNGVDLGAPNGTPIYAAAAGTVIVSRIGGWNGGYGNYVVIKHDNGTQTLYSHMSSDIVSVGDSVSKGQRIGAVGKTGEATGFHLHYEVRGARNPFASCSVKTRCTPD